MFAMSRFVPKVALVLLVIGLSAGCATTGQLEEVRAEAQRANSTANQALQVANQAQQTATEANARSMETDEKLNRMFQRSMMK